MKRKLIGGLVVLSLAGILNAAESPDGAACLVAGTENWAPAYSPDGQTLAYLQFKEKGSGGEAGTVCLGIRTEDGNARTLAEIAAVPSGNRLAQSYFFPKILWSRDGQCIFFLRQNEKQIQCGKAAVSNGNVEVLGELGIVRDYLPRQFLMMPDGRLAVSFWFTRLSSLREPASVEGLPLALFDPARKGVERTAEPYKRIFPVPGETTVLATAPTNVWKLDPDFHRIEKVAEFDDPEDVRAIHFAGRDIILVLRRDIMKTDGDYKLLAGGKVEEFLSSPAGFDQMAVLDDGRLLWARAQRSSAPISMGGGLMTASVNKLERLQVVTVSNRSPQCADVEFDCSGLRGIGAFFPSPDGRRAVAVAYAASSEQPVISLGGDGVRLPAEKKTSKFLVLIDGKGNAISGAKLENKATEGAFSDDVVWTRDGKSLLVTTLTPGRVQGMLPGWGNMEFLSRGEIWKIDL